MLFNRPLITSQLTECMQHTPTADQRLALARIVDFLETRVSYPCLILKGFAGTGKTTLIAALVRLMLQYGKPFLLLAPTGRAAKVAGDAAQSHASTIHRAIYVPYDSEGGTRFGLRQNTVKNRLFVVDEASMIGEGSNPARPDSLLRDLASYIYQDSRAKLLIVGDTAQLPPVCEVMSPALDAGRIRTLFPHTAEVALQEVVRQAKLSGILRLATSIRESISEQKPTLPAIHPNGTSDIRLVHPRDAMELLARTYSNVGTENTMVICRSNRQAVRYNLAIRRNILGFEMPLDGGDRMMVCRNSYFWTKKGGNPPFLANGDTIVVHRAKNFRSIHGMEFADLDFSLEDTPNEELYATANLAAANALTPALSSEQGRALYTSIRAELEAEMGSENLQSRLRTNPYINALELKYGYAITCHKAQGGQWDCVFVDPQIFADTPIDLQLLRWLYTAFTRARKMLYIVAPPEAMVAKEAREEFFTDW